MLYLCVLLRGIKHAKRHGGEEVLMILNKFEQGHQNNTNGRRLIFFFANVTRVKIEKFCQHDDTFRAILNL